MDSLGPDSRQEIESSGYSWQEIESSGQVWPRFPAGDRIRWTFMALTLGKRQN